MLTPYYNAALIPSLLVFDIETVAEVEFFDQLSERKQGLWIHTTDKLIRKGTIKLEDYGIFDTVNYPEYLTDCAKMAWKDYACLYAEFAKIASLSVGVFTNKNELKFHPKNWTSHDETEILAGLSGLFQNLNIAGKSLSIAGFAINQFDIPFLVKRYIINGGIVPEELNFLGKKPWEISTQDLSVIWQGIGMQDRYMIKLDLLAECLGIETSKDEMYGGDVYRVYYQEKDLAKIGRYCDKDVKVTAQCFLRLSGLDINIVK